MQVCKFTSMQVYDPKNEDDPKRKSTIKIKMEMIISEGYHIKAWYMLIREDLKKKARIIW